VAFATTKAQHETESKSDEDEYSLMKKQLLMLAMMSAGMAFLPTLAMAAPDFNGAWVRDNAKSDPAPNAMYWLTRGGPTPGGGGRGNAQFVMTVHEDAKGIQVADSQTAMREYVLDGKPHTRATDTGIQKAEVKAALQGDTLVIETTQPYGGMPGNATLKVKEVWALSPDGKTLTITTTRDVAAKQQTFKQVYNWRQPTPGEICSAGCVVPQ
jgi:hypothetical protein